VAHADRITARAVRQHLPSHRVRESRRHDDPAVLPAATEISGGLVPPPPWSL